MTPMHARMTARTIDGKTHRGGKRQVRLFGKFRQASQPAATNELLQIAESNRTGMWLIHAILSALLDPDIILAIGVNALALLPSHGPVCSLSFIVNSLSSHVVLNTLCRADKTSISGTRPLADGYCESRLRQRLHPSSFMVMILRLIHPHSRS